METAARVLGWSQTPRGPDSPDMQRVCPGCGGQRACSSRAVSGVEEGAGDFPEIKEHPAEMLQDAAGFSSPSSSAGPGGRVGGLGDGGV